jgi:hypothetical protein
MADVVEEVGEEVAEEVEEVAEEAEEIADEEDEFVASGAAEVKIFGKWSFNDIEIRDMSLEVRYYSHPYVPVDGQRSVVAAILSLLLLMSYLTNLF